MNTPIQDRSAIRLQNAYSYVAEYFPELSEANRMMLSECLVKALFKPIQTDPDFQESE